MPDAAQIARELYAKHQEIQVTDWLLDDLVMLYAETLKDDEVEAFVERMAEDAYKAAIRLDFCHCCMAINAALKVEDDEVFRHFIGLLDLSEDDEVLVRMKHYILRKLADDAMESVEGEDEARFRRRVDEADRAV